MNEKLEELYKSARRKQEIIIKQKPQEEFYKTEEFYEMMVEDLIENILTAKYYEQKYKENFKNGNCKNAKVEV